MPQNNPAPSLQKSTVTFETGLATADFELVPAATEDWFIRKIFTIPKEFSGIEFVLNIRSILGSTTPQIIWYSELAPGEDFVTYFDSQTIDLPSAVGGGGASYPGILKMGIGPNFVGAVTNRPAGDPINQSNFVPLLGGIGAGVYIDTTITTPIQMIFTLSQTPAATPPDIDATMYHTFYA